MASKSNKLSSKSSEGPSDHKIKTTAKRSTAVVPKSVSAAAAAPSAAPVAPTAVTPARAATVAEVRRDRTGVLGLIAKLRDVDADVARDAATALGSLPVDAEAVNALAEAVVNAHGYFHSVVRVAAATALGRLGSHEAVDALIYAVRDPMAEASEEAVRALGLIGDRRAIPALQAAVNNDDGFFLENVRRTAEDALSRITSSR
jgi:HEAT repeat protein